MNLRRFGPLIGAMLLAVAVLVSRLYDVQVVEHDFWAREAVNLVRSWSVLPYHRGSIRDRDGRLLARDEEVYRLEFVWRDFRRGHPLGQVAEMRSLVVMRSVPLEEARAHLALWARDFVRLTPAQIDAFGRGGALELGTLAIPAVEGATRRERRDRARRERRRTRAGDLHFYLRALLDPERRTWSDLARKKNTKAWETPYIELVAGLEDRTPLALWSALQEDLAASLEHLDQLAARIDWEGLAVETPGSADGPPGARLVALIEAKRRQVESAVADDLFRRAAGFEPSRLDRANLERIDLEWLRLCMSWDGHRLERWRASRGRAWEGAVERYLAGHVIARSKLARERFSAGDRVLSSLAFFFNGDDGGRTLAEDSAAPRHWSQVDELVVLAGFDERFEHGADLGAELDRPVLPVQAGELRGMGPGLGETELLRRALADVPFEPRPGTGGEPPPLSSVVERMLAVARSEGRAWRDVDQRDFGQVLHHWNALLQRRVAVLFDALPDGVELVGEWVDTAVGDRAYVVRDRGARAMDLDRDPPYELVHLVTRYPDRYAGFQVRTTTRRRAMELLEGPAGSEPIPVAEPLIGGVRTPYLVSLLEQRPVEAYLARLRTKVRLDAADREPILQSVGSTRWQGELMGHTGIEGYFDPELRGRNGYRESTGLQDRRRGNRKPINVAAVDGEEIILTLQTGLQRAAQAIIDAPRPPPAGEERPDRVWHRYPVGAIGLITVDGAVLAAASGPSRPGAVGPGQDGQRTHAADRTLRQHTFQPPGSVLKPFVAVWALDRGWIDPTGFEVVCQRRDGDRLGTHREGAAVHCHSSGHGGVHLHRALTVSCNAYFAALGEFFFDGESFREMAGAFGFGRPTGVRSYGEREGLREDYRSDGFLDDPLMVADGRMQQRLTNGLSHISATPLQVARAYAGLATGVLPQLRLVERIGGQRQPAEGRPLGLSTASLEAVRRALRDVPLHGSAAHRGLDPASLGFSFACKTGSADYKHKGLVPVDPRAPISTSPAAWEEGVRKHAWLAGWFPAEDPVAVAVVYVHDTSTTSSRVTTLVMAEFLGTQAVRGWLREQGVEVKR